MLPDKDIMCHHTGFVRSCRDIVVECRCQKYVHVQGTNPNTGQPVDRWGCIDGVQHILMIENSQQQRQTGAAIESFRNEMVSAHRQQLGVALAQLSQPEQGRLQLTHENGHNGHG